MMRPPPPWPKDEEDVDDDPILGALAAKRKRLGEALRNAAKSVPASVQTWLDDTSAPKASSGSFPAPPPVKGRKGTAAASSKPPPGRPSSGVVSQAGDAAQQEGKQQLQNSSEHKREECNGLATLLNYGDDDDDEEASGNRASATPHPTSTPAVAAQEGVDASESKGSSGDGDNIDKELALFMKQLESDGLLQDETSGQAGEREEPGREHAAATVAGATLQTDTYARSQSTGPVPAESATPTAPAPAAAAAAAGQDQDAAAGQGGVMQQEGLGEQEMTEGGAEAEQKVLGYLSQEPEWSKVLDTGSGQVYYWHLGTNEVVWEVPAGFNPDDLIPPEEEEAGQQPAEQEQQPQQQQVAELEETGPEGSKGVLGATAEAAVEEASVTGTKPTAGPGGVSGGAQAGEGTGAGATGKLETVSGAEDVVMKEAQKAGELGRPPSGASTGEHLAALVQSTRSAARYLLAALPAVVRLAVEAEVRHSDWQVLSSQHEQHERHHEQQQQQQQQVPDSVAPQAMGTEHARKAGGLPSIKQEPPEQHIPRGTPPADPSQAAPSPPPDQSQRPTAATPAPASSAPHSKDKGECKSGATSSTQGGGDAAGAALRALLGDVGDDDEQEEEKEEEAEEKDKSGLPGAKGTQANEAAAAGAGGKSESTVSAGEAADREGQQAEASMQAEHGLVQGQKAEGEGGVQGGAALRPAAAARWGWQAYEAYVRARADRMWNELPAATKEAEQVQRQPSHTLGTTAEAMAAATAAGSAAGFASRAGPASANTAGAAAQHTPVHAPAHAQKATAAAPSAAVAQGPAAAGDTGAHAPQPGRRSKAAGAKGESVLDLPQVERADALEEGELPWEVLPEEAGPAGPSPKAATAAAGVHHAHKPSDTAVTAAAPPTAAGTPTTSTPSASPAVSKPAGAEAAGGPARTPSPSFPAADQWSHATTSYATHPQHTSAALDPMAYSWHAHSAYHAAYHAAAAAAAAGGYPGYPYYPHQSHQHAEGGAPAPPASPPPPLPQGAEGDDDDGVPGSPPPLPPSEAPPLPAQDEDSRPPPAATSPQPPLPSKEAPQQPPLPGIDREEDDMDIGDDMDISHEQPPASTEAHALQGYTAADVHTHAQAYAQQQGGGAAGLQSGPGQAALELASSGVAASRTAGEPGIGEAEGVPKVKRKEYAAGAVRSATPPVLQQPAVEAVAGEGAGLAGQGPAGGVAGGGAVGAGGVGLEKKRRAEKAAGSSSGSSAKRSKGVMGSGKVSAMLNQWSSVKKSLQEEEEEQARREAEMQDPEAMERKRLQELDRWREQQASKGEEEENANFAPVMGDWRKTLAKQHKSSKSHKHGSSSKKSSKSASADKAAGGYPTNSKSRPDLESLSAGLPQGWQAMWDKKTGDIYYGNPTTKETSWSRP